MRGMQALLVARALKYTHYDFFKRMMLRLLNAHLEGAKDAGEDHEYTDWQGLEAFVDEFLEAGSKQPEGGAPH
jgi:menaquinone-dependent protoporphyrinogen oxidase